MRRLVITFLLANVALIALVCVLMPKPASAHIGVAVGPHMGMSDPLIPHVGPVYYKPSGVSEAESASEDVLSELENLDHVRKDPEKLRAARCRELSMEYFWRHGVTTPRPLRGYHGCQKYAMDAAYWAHRRNERVNFPSGPLGTIRAQVGQAARAILQTA